MLFKKRNPPVLQRPLIQIFHNTRPFASLNGFQPTHPLRLVFSYHDETPIPPEQESADQRILDQQFLRFNEMDNHPYARKYFEAGNRSLSDGDVVAIDGRCYACTTTGWRRLTTSPLVSVSPH